MSAIVDVVLGIVTSIGGFIEAGSISTSAQAGAEFGFQLLWAIAIATVMLAVMIEMSGRLAAVSRRTIDAAVRERFGISFQWVPLAAELGIDTLLLSAEIGGAAIAVKLLTGIGFLWWVAPVGLLVWLILMLFGFSVIEYGFGLLGLVTLSFVYAAYHLQPPRHDLVRSLAPSMPHHDLVRYAFLSVSILGATVSPYLLNFYSSGTIEEKLTEKELWVNRTTAYLGICFGGVVSMGVLVTSAMVLGPKQIIVDSYDQAALMLVPVFHRWGIALFACSLGVGCLGAAVEIAINAAYAFSQALGWSWGANKARSDTARFAAAFTLITLAGTLIALLGFDPLRLTMISLALTVVIMPVIVLPFLALMNDDRYVKTHTNSAFGNAFLAGLTLLGALLAIIVLPLEVLGG
ncbi:MAG TPA: divalent metal cation transporter [Vicinamibacterales bacterium]|nr:divalent metal cation transporter [Vicinamibacterales bacterium]